MCPLLAWFLLELMCEHIFLWHLNDIFCATSACKGNGCWHGLLRCIILIKESCIYKMRPNLNEWLDIAIYLPFPTLIIFQALM